MSETDAGQNTRLIEALRARKLVEEDATRLANRLAQLKKEEERSQKRIEETRKRAAEILNARRRNEEIRAQREQQAAEKQAELEAQREQILTIAKETQRRKLDSIEAFARLKMGKVAETKEEKAALEKLLVEQRLLEQQKVIERKEAIQAMHKDMKQKTQLEKERSLAKIRQEYETRLKSELAYQRNKEKEVQRMARLEMELIHRLQKKQEEQRQAFEELESVLGINKASSSKPTSPTATGGASPNAEEAQLSRAFGELDPSGSGRVQTQFVGPLLEKLGLHLNPEQLERAKMQLDPVHVGAVTYRDFVAWWRG